jgi:chemotaxis protein histidine kinase CheA
MHLVRNAICHGIEDPATRASRGKPSEGQVRLCARHQGGQLIIEVSDDGAGIPVDRIRRMAMERQLVRPGDVERILARRNAMLIDFIKVLKKHPPLRAPGGP